MAPRLYWKGYLKLSLVSCPVSIHSATSESERVSFRQVNAETGNRLKQQLVDSVTGEVVASDQKAKGYEIGRDRFLIVDAEELDAIEIESTRTIDIERFVPRADIDRRYYDSPYYITPTERVGEEAFAVIREAMRDEDMVALGRVVLSKRERIIALEPHGKGLLATTLRYAYEVRGEADYFSDIPDLELPAEMRELARHIIRSKAGEFNPAQFEDRYEQAVVALLKRKQAGLPAEKVQAAPTPSSTINLMEVLRASVKADVAARRPTPRAPAAAADRRKPAAAAARKRRA
jgi:DNA end-binding protein Ku